MEILDEIDDYFRHRITHSGQSTEILYNPANRDLKVFNSDEISKKIIENKSQLLKILHTKRSNTFYPGFSLNFVLMENKVVSDFHDMSKVIILDRRNGNDHLGVSSCGLDPIHEVFTDGCFLEQENRSGIAVVIKSPKGKYSLEHVASDANNNCLAELEAAIAGLQKLKNQEKVRLITDSRYVRKGLTEWMHYWRLNNWMTANGEPAKNINQWKKIDQLTDGKYIEVAWVKGHSGHFENTMCDLYARDAAERP